ncbi:hypothetical protein [Undibacterium sp. Ji22W]|uniref:hypothetical protein n=1 Tax=Undibacterium sp. Ji22W TaxID=3413038 RepID=UPI003BF337D2
MYALKVQVNERTPIVGGTEDLGVLSAILSCSGKLGSATNSRGRDDTKDFSFRLGGLTARFDGVQDEHLVWLEDNNLALGDRVTIEIVEVNLADPIIRGQEAETRAEDERAYFEHCKRTYFEMREKYESDV